MAGPGVGVYMARGCYSDPCFHALTFSHARGGDGVKGYEPIFSISCKSYKGGLDPQPPVILCLTFGPFVFNRNRGSDGSTLISCSASNSSSGRGHRAGVPQSICLGSIRCVWNCVDCSFRPQPRLLQPLPPPPAQDTLFYTFPPILFPL